MTATPESVEAAAARLEEMAPGYLDLIRSRAAELGLPRTPAERARRSAALVARTAHINPDAPVHSRQRSARIVKRVVRKLTRFYIVSVGEQVAELGESASWMGRALCEYVAALEAEVADLRDRVGRLEQGPGRP